MISKTVRRNDLLYPGLSYQIIGVLFDVYNQFGNVQKEQVYQKAVAKGLRDIGIKFKEQVYVPLEYHDQKIGSEYLDFLIDDKVILEIKKGDKFSKTHIDQLHRYLVNSNLRLGILAYFAPRKIHFKRIVNLN